MTTPTNPERPIMKTTNPNPTPGTLLSDGTIYLGQNEAGDHIAVMPRNHTSYLSWDAAMEWAKNLTAHGHNDWRLPELDECQLIYQSQDLGELKGTFDKSGSFPASILWSARRYDSSYAYCQWLGVGSQTSDRRTHELSVRAVRRCDDLIIQSFESPEDETIISLLKEIRDLLKGGVK